MIIIPLSEAAYYEQLNKSHNPPGPDTSKEVFDEEYYALFDRVATVLSEHGENDPYEQGDYYLEPLIAKSRGLGFTITNDSIVTASLLLRLQQIVSQFAPDWEIHVGSSEYAYGIFIGPSSIRMYRRDEDVLSQLDEFLVPAN